MTIHRLTAVQGNLTLTGLSKVSCLWQFSEWYLASGRRFRVKKIDKNNLLTLQSDPKKPNVFLTLVKKISYLTIFLLIATSIIRKSHRKKYFITAQTKRPPLPTTPIPVSSPQPIPQQPSITAHLNQMNKESDLILNFAKACSTFKGNCTRISFAIKVANHIDNTTIGSNDRVLTSINEALEAYREAFDACKQLESLSQRLVLGSKEPERKQLKNQVQVLKDLLLEVYPDVPPSYLDAQDPTHKKLLKAWPAIIADV